MVYALAIRMSLTQIKRWKASENAAAVVHGRAMIPLRFVAASFGAKTRVSRTAKTVP